jgi:PAS domain S-box-containing protein
MKKDKLTYEELEKKVFELEQLIIKKPNNTIKSQQATTDYFTQAESEENLKKEDKKEKALISYNAKVYRDLINNLEAGVVVHAPDTSIISNNIKASELLGLNEDQMKGKMAFDPQWHFVFEDKTPVPIDDYPVNRIIRSRKPIKNLFLGVNRPVTNDLVWLNVSGFPMLNEHGEIAEIVISFIDNTKRKLYEEAMKESEEKYRLLIENSGIGVAVFSIEGRIQMLNVKAVENLGGKIENYIGKTLHEVFGEQAGSAYMKRIVDASLSEKSVEYEDFVQLDSGSYWLLSNHTGIKDSDGKIIGVQVLSHNISERKMTEEKIRNAAKHYQTLIEKATDGIALLNAAWRFTFVSPTARKIFGYGESDDISVDPADYTHPDDLPYVQSELFKIFEDPSYSPTIQYRFISKSGNWKWIESTFSNLLTDPNVESIVINFRDITDRKQAEGRITKLNDCFLRFGSDPVENINQLVAFCGELMHASTALYNRIEDGILHSLGQWKTPADYKARDYAEGHLCNEVINSPNDKILIINNLQNTVYAQTDPNVRHYKLKTYIGKAVKFNKVNIGSLCVVYQHDYAPDNNELHLMEIVASAIGVEDERRQANKALRESEENHRHLIENSHDIIYILNSIGILTYASPAWTVLLGHTTESVIGKSFHEFVHLDDIAKCMEWLGKIIETGQRQEGISYRVQHIDGSWVWHSSSGVPLKDSTGMVIGFEGTARDITKLVTAEEKLRESEYRYRIIIETANEGILVAQGSNLRFINPAMTNYTGYTQEELMEIPFLDLVHPDDKSLVKNNYIKRLNGETFEPRYHFRVLSKSHETKWVEMSGAKIEWEGKPATLNFLCDISERLLAEQEIKRNNEELQALNLEKDKFFSIIAHDLRSPFNVFLGFTQMLVDDLPTMRLPELQKIALMMRNSAGNLFNLLENLLEWSRIQRGLINFDPKSLVLLPKIEEFITPVAELAKKKEIQISVQIPADIIVFADENMLASIIRNIASNAVKFTPSGGKISLKATKKIANTIEISVKDSGIGMSNEMIENLFQLNSHTNRKGTDGEPSSGLGLFICKDFLERQGGRIWAEPNPEVVDGEKGSTFKFTLPVSKI